MLSSGVGRRIVAALLRPSTWLWPYVVLWCGVGFIPITQTDLDLFFWPTATVAVDGRPLMVYSALGGNAYPDANGPVSLIPLTVVGLIARSLDWLSQWAQRRVLLLSFCSVFMILMARQAVATVDRLRGAPVRGPLRLIAYAVFALAPCVWQAVSGYGHIEQPIEVWLLLIAASCLSRGWMLRGGIAFGLAVLSRSPGALMAIPFALYCWQKGWRSLASMVGATAATGVAGLLPFFLADRMDVVHSLFTYRGGLPVGAGSIWGAATDLSVIAFAQHWDILFVVAAALAANLWLATRPGGMTDIRLIAGMALSAICFLCLAKTIWPYYFFEAFMLGTVWTFGGWTAKRGYAALFILPVAVSVLGLVAEIGSTPFLDHSLVAIEGEAMFAALGLLAVWLGARAGGAWTAAARPTG